MPWVRVTDGYALAMSVTARTRRILWIKTGGRCSICHEQLATDALGDDDPSVFGEECHIVAQSPGGPRSAEVTSHGCLVS